MALELRIEDVRRRKNIIAILKHEREVAIKAEEDRNAKREEELNADKTVSFLNSYCVTVMLIFVLLIGLGSSAARECGEAYGWLR